MEVFLIKTLQFLMAISLLVLLHELGHFTFAKLFKVRVSRFYLFFNPKFHILSTYDTWVRRLFKMKPEVVPTKKDEDGNESKEYVGTEYGLGWLPLGGYCAIDGMIDETNQKLSKEAHPWEFRTKPTWQRLLIMIGGVLVNFLLALFIYSMVLFTWGETYIPLQSMKQGMEFNEQAKAIGFQDGDILMSTDQKEFKNVGADMYRMICNAKQVNVLRNGKPVTINIPQEEKSFLFFTYEASTLSLIDMAQNVPIFVRPKLGFQPVQIYEPITLEYGFLESFPAGIKYGWNTLCSYINDMKYLFSSDGVKQMGGFGAIGSLFPSAWDWHQFWLMTAFLSIILAFMNILPIPALDGGHVLFLLYEMITRRKPSENFMIRAEYVGFGILILLMVVANLNDILRWLHVM